MEDKKFAILIDGDNTSPQYIKTIIDEVTKEGTITFKRVYGDWTSTNLNCWKQILLEYSLNPMQQYAYTTGKNATDSAMIIDAMDILYTGKVDGFCLVSSDSDFTKLAARLREAGMTVIGMGKKQTPKPFVAACSMFKYVDLISADLTAEKPRKGAKKTVAAEAEKSTQTALKDIKTAIDNMLEENANPDGWLLASTVGTLLQKQFTDFDCRNFGCRKMIDLLKKMNYETKLSADKTTYYVSKK